MAVAFAGIVERTLELAPCLGKLFGTAAVCAAGVGKTVGQLYYCRREQAVRHILFPVSSSCHFAPTYYICRCCHCQSHREERSLVGVHASRRIEHSLLGFYAYAHYIVLSLVFDGLDGRVARLTNTTSKFGVEFDSLADIVAFGVAPAMLFYFSVGQNFGRFGVLITALFVIFGGVRLARFNVMSGASEPNVFIGLPIPTAAVLFGMNRLFGLKLSRQDLMERGVKLR